MKRRIDEDRLDDANIKSGRPGCAGDLSKSWDGVGDDKTQEETKIQEEMGRRWPPQTDRSRRSWSRLGIQGL
jgi:hypothetical protein